MSVSNRLLLYRLSLALARPYACDLSNVKRRLVDILGENSGRPLLAEDAVLAEGEIGLKRELAQREADDEAFPWEERAGHVAEDALKWL